MNIDALLPDAEKREKDFTRSDVSDRRVYVFAVTDVVPVSAFSDSAALVMNTGLPAVERIVVTCASLSNTRISHSVLFPET